MSKQDLKHALISLAIGVLTMCLTQFVTGALHIVTEWLTGLAGGATTTVSYLKTKHLI